MLPGIPAMSNNRLADYPRILSDGRIIFRVDAPTARKVQIEPLNGKPENNGYNGLGKEPYEMTKNEEGFWTVTTPPVVPGFHYYSLVVDGIRVNDPSSKTYGGANIQLSGIEVPEPGVDFYFPGEVPHGQVHLQWYYSKITRAWRQVYVYTPPDYEIHTDLRYPVLHLKHGGGEDETGWIRQGQANFILDHLIAKGKAKPMIAVMDSGYATRPGETTFPPVGEVWPTAHDTIVAVTMEELIPVIDATYRTLPNRENRAMAGLSMGSKQTLAITLFNLAEFSSIGIFSRPPDPEFDVKTSFSEVFVDPVAFNEKVHLFWWGVGKAEGEIYQQTKSTLNAFDKVGIRYVFVEYPDLSHEWQTWRKSLYDFAQRLF